MNAHLLIVARGRSRRGLCGAVARRLGVVAYSAESAPQALHLLNTQAIDVVLADAGMPGLNVLDLLKSARGNSPEADVVVMADPPMPIWPRKRSSKARAIAYSSPLSPPTWNACSGGLFNRSSSHWRTACFANNWRRAGGWGR